MTASGTRAVEAKVRAICPARPGATEKANHGAPAFCEDAFWTVAPKKLLAELDRAP